MYIIQKEKNGSGGYGPLQSWTSDECPDTCWFYPDELFNEFYRSDKRVAGFVNIEVDEASKIVTNVVWNDEAYNAYVATLPDPAIEAKNKKIAEITDGCNQAINAGTDVKLNRGTKKFSYTVEDQSNISEMYMAVVGGATEYPYHANGEACEVYSAEDVVKIYSTLSLYKTSQITYNNQLKQYVNSLTTVEQIETVTYGQLLVGEYLIKYNELMTVAENQMKSVLTRTALVK